MAILKINGKPFSLVPLAGGGSGGGSTPTPPPTGTLSTFAVQNWGGASSAPLMRMGLAFKKGDIPVGSTPVIAGVQAAQFDNRATWTDGSLKFCVAHVRYATNFTASETRSHNVTAASGSYNNTGALTLAGILSGHDFKINFTSVTQSDGTTATTRGSGSLVASLATHAAVTTRVTKIRSGPVCESWQVWGMAGADADLKTYWYIDAWKNADGSVYALEVGAVVAQDWWASTTKYLLGYTATLVDGSTTIATYSSVQHPYHSSWLTCLLAANNQQGRRPWVGGTIPTLIYKPDQAYWVASGLLPPYDFTLTPTVLQQSNYVPCQSGDNNFLYDQRVNIDSPGQYIGRGLMGGRPDSDAWILRTPEAYRKARVCAHAGLGVPYHYRSGHPRTRPGESADTASTQISLIMGPDSASTYDFTADGMPAPVHAYTKHPLYVTGDSYQDAWQHPIGSNSGNIFGPAGVWAPSIGASHAVCYSSGMYRLEGEYYHLEVTLDLATNLCHQLNSGYNTSRGIMLAGSSEFSAVGAPTTIWDANCGMWDEYNQRSVSWAANILGETALCGTDHVANNYFKKLRSHVGNWCAASLTYMPTDVKAAGVFTTALMTNAYPPWGLQGFGTQCFCHAFRMTEDTNYRDVGWTLGNYQIGVFNGPAPWLTAAYRVNAKAKNMSGWNASTNPYLSPDQLMFNGLNVTIAGAVVTCTLAGNYWDASGSNVLPITNGDKIRFSTSDQNASDGYPIPPEVADGQLLYVVGRSSATYPCTFGLSAAPGGSAISFATAYNGSDKAHSIWLDWIPQAANVTVAQGAYTPGADSYELIHAAAFAMLKITGHTGATDALNNKVKTFTSAIDKNGWTAWSLKV